MPDDETVRRYWSQFSPDTPLPRCILCNEEIFHRGYARRGGDEIDEDLGWGHWPTGIRPCDPATHEPVATPPARY